MLDPVSQTFNLGDNTTRQQYRGILSFRTGDIPDNATITNVVLKVKLMSIVGGGNPITVLQGFMADIKNGFFGASASLESQDFQVTGTGTVGPFKPALASNTYTINLSGGSTFVNKLAARGGLTQIRLRFKLDDNNDALANYLSLFSGDASSTANRPQLIITYSIP